MRTTAGKAIAALLKAHGVTCVFGMEDPVEIVHGLDGNSIRTVTVHDEKHGAIMAHGYARATGRPGVCLATCGPGATNLITGLLEAQKSSNPVIAFVQDIPAENRGRHAASEIHHEACLGPFVKWVGRIETPTRALETAMHAFRISTSGRPGPVVVLCPPDVIGTEIEWSEAEIEGRHTHYPSTRSRASRDATAEAAGILLAAERPVILAGGGAVISGAADEVVELAEALNAPVATTMNGKGLIADGHPLSAGVSGSSTGGLYGRGRIANTILGDADAVLIAGSRNGQICSMNWTLPAPGCRIVQIDVDAQEIGRNFPTDVGLVGDAREVLRDLCETVEGDCPRAADPRPRLDALRAEWRAWTRAVFTSEQTPIRPERVMREVSALIDEDTIIVTDASYVTGWAMSHIDTPGGGRAMISPRGTGGIGWSLPAAIGAMMARPGSRVLCLTGDGAFGYVFNELETAARYGVAVVVVVLNNGTLAFQKHFERKLYGVHRECDFLDIDYAEVARSLKCQGERVTKPGAVAGALKRGLACSEPYVIDVAVDPEAMAPIVGLSPDRPMTAH